VVSDRYHTATILTEKLIIAPLVKGSPAFKEPKGPFLFAPSPESEKPAYTLFQ
jgi:hypothetical protein